MALGVSLRLAKAGYWQGDPGRIMRAPADEVLAVLQYENFNSDYERATFELNKERS
jgi:hypothetical protein